MRYQVLWDGRRKGPGGAQLFAAEPPRATVPTPEPLGRDALHDRIVALLKAQPLTLRQLARETHRDIHNVNGVVYHLRTRGVVKVVGQVPRTDHRYGRTMEHLFGLVDRPVGA